MANFFKASTNKSLTKKQLTVQITHLDNNGCGVARFQSKPLFVQGALPDEIVEVKLIEQRSKFARAKLIKIQESSIDRVQAKCQHFGVCGGCDLQILPLEQQLPFKQQKITDLFSRYLAYTGEENELLPWQTPIVKTPWNYRRKARLGVQFNKRMEAVIGFRQKSTNALATIKHCPVLVEPLSDIFPVLKALIAQLTVKAAIGHIEVIYADIENTDNKVTLVVRQLKPLSECDINLWKMFAVKQHWQVVIDDGEHKSCITSESGENSLSYKLPALIAGQLEGKQSGSKAITINFSSNDFIQINHKINVAMIEQALSWLAIKPKDNVLDLFCGLGNFSLAMATVAGKVTGVEGVQIMADKAKENANQNNLHNCQFYQANLNEHWLEQPWAKQGFDKVLLDPARAGAEQAVQQIAQLKIPIVLYVSCDPATLARDSQLLISQGYQLDKMSLIDMFSQTKHVETMVLFTLKKIKKSKNQKIKKSKNQLDK